MSKRLTKQLIIQALSNSGYVLRGDIEYKNTSQKLPVICKNGHNREITRNRLYKKQTCAICMRDQKRFSIDFVRTIFEKEGYTLISNVYVGSAEKLEVTCPKGHYWRVSLNKFNCKRRCVDCMFHGGSSRSERALFDAIYGVYPTAKKMKLRRLNIKDRPYVKGFDIDIYIPELKKGIEFDGTYFHSKTGLKRSYPDWPDSAIRNYHKIKDTYFKSKNITLLHIPEADWKRDRIDCIERCLLFLRSDDIIKKRP